MMYGRQDQKVGYYKSQNMLVGLNQGLDRGEGQKGTDTRRCENSKEEKLN